MTVTCPYCDKPAELVDSAEIYHGQSYGMAWLCRLCNAYVGCHKDTTKPLGRLANAELRKWKIKAHAAFDPLWKFKSMKRGNAYKWLAKELGITDVRKDCHIGMFDVDTCKLVVKVCDEYRNVAA